MSKQSIKEDNIFHQKTIISNEETISNNSDVNPTGLEEDIGHNLHDVTSCQVYDNDCESNSIYEPNNAHIKREITFHIKHGKDDITTTATTYGVRKCWSIPTTAKKHDTKQHLLKRIRVRSTKEHLSQNTKSNNKYSRRNGADIEIYSIDGTLLNNNINK